MDPRPDETSSMPSQPEPAAGEGPSVEQPAELVAEPQTEPQTGLQTEPLTAADAAAAVEPVGAAPSPPGGGSRARWLIGGGIAVAAVAAVALGASFLAASPLPEILKYLPRDSAIVVELRPELPGDQRQHLGNLLAHFPGFEDQSTLDTKLDEVLERITRESSNGEVDYATQVKPLLAGPMAISVTAAALTDMMSGSTADGVLFVATTDGSATCDSIFGSTSVATTHRQVEIRSIAGDVGCALHERYLLVGSVGSISDGIDARLDGKGLDGSSTYKAARSELKDDQVASLYLETDPIYDAIRDMAGPLGMEVGTLPEAAWIISGVRITDDAVIVDMFDPVGTGPFPSGAPTSAPASESRFATILPADTLGFLEGHGLGATFGQGMAVLREDPLSAEALQQLEDALRIAGGADNVIGWIEDYAIVIVPTDDSVGGAVLIRGTDAETAKARLVQIRNLLVLGSTGTDITMSDSDHNGVTVTTVDLGDLSSLVGPMGFPGVTGSDRLEIAFAARDDLVIIAGGGGIVERILDVEAGASLATSATYDRAIDIAGATNHLQLYVALDTTLAMVERFLPAEQKELWTTDVKPYLDHLAGIAMTSLAPSSGGHSRVVVTVK